MESLIFLKLKRKKKPKYKIRRQKLNNKRHVCVCVLAFRPKTTFENQKLTFGSRLMTLTVLSERPTARNLDLCSPGVTRPMPIQITSDFISLRSVYSFSCPVCGVKGKKDMVTFISIHW